MLREFGSRVFMVGSDYIYPYESNRIMGDLVAERGGERIAEVYLPLDASWESYITVIRKIKASSPDFIFSTVVGEGTALLHRAFAQVKLDPAASPIASLTTCEAEVREMGVDIAEGHITSAPYFQSLPTASNQQCVSNFKRRFGADEVTNMCWEAAYFQTHLLAQGMRQTNGDNVPDLLRVLPGAEIMAPQGRVKIDEHNHHTYLQPRIGRVNPQGQFDILSQSENWVRPDPYLVSHTLQDWSASAGVRAP
jgi:branched-chain amino acid transport system substrate-binding protein